MSVVFINCTSETFTPTKSGAIATGLWKLCCAAKAEGISPIVVTCPSDAAPYPWPETVFVSQPRTPTKPWTIAAFRLQRRFNGWRYLRQKEFALRVVREIRRRSLQRLPLIFHNDPEMAVLFRESFPESRIIHHFHNQHTCNNAKGCAASLSRCASHGHSGERFHGTAGSRTSMVWKRTACAPFTMAWTPPNSNPRHKICQGR